MKRITPQYLAGVADSDGSFSLTRCSRPSTVTGYHYRTLFQLTWEDTPLTRLVLSKMKDLYGGSFSECNRKPDSYCNKHKTVLKYSVEGQRLGIFIKELLPYLVLKRERAEIILEFIRYRELSKKTVIHRVGRKKDLEDWSKEDRIYEKMNGLNSKNKKI